MPALTQLGYWNNAAYKIGAKRFVQADITSPSTSSNPNALIFNDVDRSSVDEVLEEHPWSFAVQTVPMIPLNPPDWVTDTAYVIGQYVQEASSIYYCAIAHTSGVFATDLIAGDWVLQSGVAPLLVDLPSMNDGVSNPYYLPTDFINPYLFGSPTAYRKEMIKPPYLAAATICLILSNNNVGAWKYVYENLTVSTWSAKFHEAVACKLAYNLCFKISEAAQFAAAMNQAYDKALISAIGADSNTSTPDQAIADEWFIARLTGATNVAPWGITPGSPPSQPYS